MKITRMGAYRQAQELAAALGETESQLSTARDALDAEREKSKELSDGLDKMGALTLVEIQAQTVQASNELDQVRSTVAAERSAADVERKRVEDELLTSLAKQEAEAKERIDAQIATERDRLAQVTGQVNASRAELAQLETQVIGVREAITLQEVGLYDFAHPAEDSVALGTRLAAVRADIKTCVRNGRATSATSSFTFNDSQAKGRKFVSDLSKMMLSAYNAEAENAVKTVKAGNLDTALKRLHAVAERVSRFGSMISLSITREYQHLRANELELTARYLAAVQAEKEAERERRAELREQAKVEAEMKRERQRLEDQLRKEREHYTRVIASLRERGDDAAATAAEAEMNGKIADVNKAIADVDYRVANQRAGYVYVISNVGAFGERMVKIGMTRRLDPMDRVRELGDASVPFRYDVHALFFSDDAPGTEAMLHRAFEEQRVNKVNARREFFYCTPQEVLDVLREKHVTVVEFKVEPDADEFRQSGGSVHPAVTIPVVADVATAS